MAGEAEAVLREFNGAMQELAEELTRFNENIQAVTEYQSIVFRVTKHLCSWMGNIEELSKHRRLLCLTTASTI